MFRVIVLPESLRDQFASLQGDYELIVTGQPLLVGRERALATQVARELRSQTNAWLRDCSQVCFVSKDRLDPSGRLVQTLQGTLKSQVNRSQFDPKVRVVGAGAEFPRRLALRQVRDGVYVLCEYGESVVDLDAVRDQLPKPTKKELYDIASNFVADVNRAGLEPTLDFFAEANLVTAITRTPEAAEMRMLQAKSRSAGEGRLMFVYIDPRGLLLAAAAKVHSDDSQNRAIRLGVERFNAVSNVSTLPEL